MPTDNLYEILEIQTDATPEQVRKAYKKRALQTHPDRAPAEEKAQAEERFRQVNNAYEVLNDPEKRLSYDRHGVWPPPNEDVRHNHNPYNPHNTTRSHPFHPNIFTFTDPFELFESFFGHPSPFHDHFPFGQARGFHDPFFAPTPFQFPQAVAMNPPDPRIGMGGGLFQNPFLHESFMPPMMGGGHFHPQGPRDGGRHVPFFSSTSSYSANRGPGGSQWASESHFTSTVNGLTTRAHERVDSSGNVHTTTTHPDGNKTYTINGVPQALGQVDATPPPYLPHSNPTGYPRHPNHHHRHHQNDRSQGRHYRHNTHRDYDRDYFPDYHDLRRPNA